MIKTLPSIEILRELFIYEKARGKLVWRARPNAVRGWNTRNAGKDAGYRRVDGYFVVAIDGTKYFLHRLIWKMDTGIDPAPLLDHRDTNTSHNHKDNLREASVAQNMMNQRAWGSLPKGVYFHRKSKTFCARITVSGKCLCLGYHPNAELASQSYAKAAIKYFGDFANLTARAA